MEVQFLGGAREVTGSMHLVRVGGRRILLDCGLFQGRRKHAFERNRNFPFEPR
jgi:metallo-beta-lactamase family protein